MLLLTSGIMFRFRLEFAFLADHAGKAKVLYLVEFVLTRRKQNEKHTARTVNKESVLATKRL